MTAGARPSRGMPPARARQHRVDRARGQERPIANVDTVFAHLNAVRDVARVRRGFASSGTHDIRANRGGRGGGARAQAIELNREIIASRSAGEILAIVEDRGESF